MDTSETFTSMLDSAIRSEPEAFKGFDRTNNVQDQLQEMVGFGGDLIGGQVLLLMEYVRSLDDKYQFISWEQLWLAFVMHEKFSKVRPGFEWVPKV